MSQTPISQQTRQLLAKHGLFLKKSLGQNFLTDPNVLEKIVAAAEISVNTGVIEIGPGIGALTEKLAEQSNEVMAVELDDRLIPVLEEMFQDNHQIKFIHGDALKMDFKELIDDFEAVNEVVVVANLPYYITSPILIHLLMNRYPFKRLVVMIQKEVADRLMAKPCSKAYGSISVLVQYFAHVEKVISVPKQVFFPQPKVDSTVIRLNIREQPAVQVVDEPLFFKVVRAAFAKRRKTLLNALHTFFSNQLSKQEISELLIQAQINPNRRGETCSLAEFANLTTLFYNQLT